MELTEEKVLQAFKMEKSDAGAKEQPVAGADEDKKNENTGNVYESAEDTDETYADTSADGQGGTEGTDDGQTVEERRANARKRRERERRQEIEAAVSAERERAKKEIDGFFADAKLTNTITGKPINSIAEYREWKEAFTDEQVDKDLKAGRVTRTQLDEMIEKSPKVQKANEIIENDKRQKEEAAKAEGKKRMDADLAEIAKYDPGIKSVADLLQMDNYEDFYKLVQRGYSFLDAYECVNRDKIRSIRADQARMAGAYNARGKSHMVPVGSARGTGASPVPPDEMAMFRVFNPKATDAEIEDYYNRKTKK